MVVENNQKSKLELKYWNICVSIVETETNIIMFNRMLRKGLATNDVASFAMKQAARKKVYVEPDKKVIKAAMKSKRADAIAWLKRIRLTKFNTRKQLVETSNNKETTVNRINNMNKRANSMRKKILKTKISKVQHLTKKQAVAKKL